jgi:hypothetical protein
VRSLRDELERWRRDGGKLEMDALSIAKGPRRIEAKGEAVLDELHRPTGRFEVSAAGLDGILGMLAAARLGGTAGTVLESLLGTPARPAPAEPQPQGAPSLTRYPPLRIENGRLFFGPMAVPGVRLLPLY